MLTGVSLENVYYAFSDGKVSHVAANIVTVELALEYILAISSSGTIVAISITAHPGVALVHRSA